MRTFIKRILLAVLLGVALLGLSGRRVFAQDRPDQQQEFPEVTTAKREQREMDEKRLKQNCGKKVKNYQLREGEFQGARNRGQTPDVLLKRQKARDQAVKELCKCLQQFYGAYGDLPAEYKTEDLDLIKLCFPPVAAPPPPGPGVSPPADPGPGDSPYSFPPIPDYPPPTPRKAPPDHPCAEAWNAYEEADVKWGSDSATVHLVFIPHDELCDCIKRHYGGNLPPEWVRFCAEGPHARAPELKATGPGAATPEFLTKPCQGAWETYKVAADQWGGDSATVSRLFTPHRDLCRCLREHYPNLPPEWVRFCENPSYSRGGTPELPIYVFPSDPRMPPITFPAEGGETPGVADQNRTDSPPRPPRAPRAGAPGSEPRSLAPGECVAQRAAYGRILAEYRSATGAARESLRPSLASAYRELCECLRITAPADYQRFCRWSSGEPPDMPAAWGPVPIAPVPDAGPSLPAGPGGQQPAVGPLDTFFGDRTKHELKGGVTFKRHGADHAKHCNSCLEVRNGVSLSMERDPSPGGIKVTVIDPPVPTIDCRARADGGFDCATVTATFCGVASQVSILHLKLGQNTVEDLGLRFDFPGDALEICVHGRAMP